MKKFTLRRLSARCLGASAALLTLSAGAAQAQIAYGTDNSGNLYRFNLASPTATTFIGSINTGGPVSGIDFNPANGQLFAVRVGPSDGNLYTVNTTTAAATPLASGFSLAAFSGATSYGFDFNPKTLQGDGSIRIRLVGNNGGDVRLNSATGAIAATDTNLAFSSGTGTPNIVAIGYSNNFAQTAGTTTLFDLDSTTDSLYIQNPPNNGTLTLVGALGIDLQTASGFDIFTAADGVTNTAYLVTDANASIAGSELYTVNLSTGLATLVGNFGGLTITDIAVVPLAVPEPSTWTAMAVGLGVLWLAARRRQRARAEA